MLPMLLVTSTHMQEHNTSGSSLGRLVSLHVEVVVASLLLVAAVVA
jgi:hypothetical protein